MNKLLQKIGLFLPILIIVISVNLIVDPANLFKGNNFEKYLANSLLDGYNIGNLDNYDDRLLQKYLIENMNSKRNVAVFGSSRSIQIDSVILQNNSLLNNSVSGASLEDFYAIYGIYKKNNKLPKQIILGIDPWLFSKESGEVRWMSIADYYATTSSEKVSKFKVTHYKLLNKLYKFISLFSPSYFQSSISRVMSLITNRKQQLSYYLTDFNEVEDSIKRTDGSYGYKKAVREISAEHANKLARDYTLKFQLKSINNYKLFENFIDMLKNDGLKIIFFLPPHNPLVFDYQKNLNKEINILTVQKYIERYSQENNIPLIGSYNPYDLNLTEEDFLDGQHLKKEAIEKIFFENGLGVVD